MQYIDPQEKSGKKSGKYLFVWIRYFKFYHKCSLLNMDAAYLFHSAIASLSNLNITIAFAPTETRGTIATITPQKHCDRQLQTILPVAGIPTTTHDRCNHYPV